MAVGNPPACCLARVRDVTFRVAGTICKGSSPFRSRSLSLLKTLSPLERAVYLLGDVFDYSPAEVGAIVQRSPEACRHTPRRPSDRLL